MGMTSREIIGQLAERRVVETFTAAECARIGIPQGADRSDLSQMVYLSLLEMDADTVERLHRDGEMLPYARKMVRNLLTQANNEYQRVYVQYSRRAVELTEPSDD